MIMRIDHMATPRWQTIAQQMRETTDSLGKPIDPGILEAVIVLNVLGFTTEQSCEGHLDRALPAPWVRIINAEAEAADDRAIVAYQQQDFIQGGIYQAQARLALAKEQSRLLDYVQRFYDEHEAATDCRLIIYPTMAGRLQLESQGAAALPAQPVEVQQAKLLDYQAEMQAFTTFLIACYCQQPQ